MGQQLHLHIFILSTSNNMLCSVTQYYTHGDLQDLSYTIYDFYNETILSKLAVKNDKQNNITL